MNSSLQQYLDMLLEKGADLAVLIDPKTVETAPWVIFKCRFGCRHYGIGHYCPPNTFTWKETREMIACYSRGILFRVHETGKATKIAGLLAGVLYRDDYYKVIAFGSGKCDNCKNCNPDHCLFPGKILPSMESCGIDVFATVRNNGIKIHTLRDKTKEEHNYFGLILVD